MPRLFQLLPLPWLMKLLTGSKKTVDTMPPEILERAEMVNSYAIGILKRNPKYIDHMCLPRSLVMYRFLRLSGVPAVFCLGVRKEEGVLIGHAWVEINGKRFHDPREDMHYFVTFSHPVPDGPENART